MRYLLDVNTLVALGLVQHEFYERVGRWIHRMAWHGVPELATCSITELGFVRVLAQAPPYGMKVAQACELLRKLKSAGKVRFEFISDDRDISYLPPWVKSARQTTDGHLAELAASKNAVLATLDRNIPGAFLIPR